MCNFHFKNLEEIPRRLTCYALPTLNLPERIHVPSEWIGINIEDPNPQPSISVENVNTDFWNISYNSKETDLDTSSRRTFRKEYIEASVSCSYEQNEPIPSISMPNEFMVNETFQK